MVTLESEKQIRYKTALELCRRSHHHQSSSQMLEMGLIMMCGEVRDRCLVPGCLPSGDYAPPRHSASLL